MVLCYWPVCMEKKLLARLHSKKLISKERNVYMLSGELGIVGSCLKQTKMHKFDAGEGEKKRSVSYVPSSMSSVLGHCVSYIERLPYESGNFEAFDISLLRMLAEINLLPGITRARDDP